MHIQLEENHCKTDGSSHLEINRISSIESFDDLSDSIRGMAIKVIEVCDSFFSKEGTSYAAVESDAYLSAYVLRES